MARHELIEIRCRSGFGEVDANPVDANGFESGEIARGIEWGKDDEARRFRIIIWSAGVMAIRAAIRRQERVH